MINFDMANRDALDRALTHIGGPELVAEVAKLYHTIDSAMMLGFSSGVDATMGTAKADVANAFDLGQKVGAAQAYFEMAVEQLTASEEAEVSEDQYLAQAAIAFDPTLGPALQADGEKLQGLTGEDHFQHWGEDAERLNGYRGDRQA